MISIYDWMVLALYGLILIYIGSKAAKKETTTDDYFLGGRTMSWFPVMISIYATSASALTFIGVPGAAFAGDFNYLQLGLGDLAGRILIAYVLLSAYYKGKVTTVYEFLGQRFGPKSRDAGTGFFIVTRLLASGVRLAGCAIALSVVFDLPLNTSIVIIAVIALIYTVMGGIKAVIWTDMLQFILFIGGASVTLFVIWNALPNGFADFLSVGNSFEKFKIFHFSLKSESKDFFLSLSNPRSFIAGFLFGAFNTFAILGTDQDMVQRMLTCKNVNDSKKALLWTAVLNFPITLLFLSVGAGLFVYYNIFPEVAVDALVATKHTDYIFPHFIKTILAPGLRGLLIAGLLAASMSSLDSALNALSSTAYIDIFKSHFYKHALKYDAIKTSRIFVVFFALILILIAMMFGKTESILWLGFRIAGYTYGAMLGIFLLAVLTKEKGHDSTNAIAMLSSVAAVMFLTSDSIGVLQPLRTAILSPLGIDKIAWPWAIFMGTLWTFFAGIILAPKKQKKSDT